MVIFNILKRSKKFQLIHQNLLPPLICCATYYDVLPSELDMDSNNEEDVARELVERWGPGKFYINRVHGKSIRCVFNKNCQMW